MTKKDYEMLADIFKENRPEEDEIIEKIRWDMIVATAVSSLKGSNERFDVNRFYERVNS